MDPDAYYTPPLEVDEEDICEHEAHRLTCPECLDLARCEQADRDYHYEAVE